MRYGYYPGCSLSGLARPYDLSTKAIAEPLGIELEEIHDWNCCGATEYFAINKMAAYALVSRNLANAANQESFTDLVAPCSACYVNLRKTDFNMGKYPELAKKVNQALEAGDLSYDPGTLKVRHLIDIVVNDIGYEAIREKVKQPLQGLRIAPYYGCLIVRPELGEPLDDPEYPMTLDRLMEALGAQVVDFPLKAHCCGGHMTQISADTAYELIRRLLHNAAEYDADAIVTLCPICQLNLDAYQSNVNRHFGTDFNIPILFFTQMIGLAMGIQPKALGIGKEFVSAAAMVRKIGTEPELEAEPVGKKQDEKSLPMPGEREG
ncbi:MAG: CoB--CoM heterodisulfide reductase iron-sulfur subunit B family protein [Anaerolineales bacterium]|jgi:heterodisulfide reductase subunit B